MGSGSFASRSPGEVVREWWPFGLAFVLLVAVLAGRMIAERPRTVELGATASAAGMSLTVHGWGVLADDVSPATPEAAEVAPGTVLSAADVESCRATPDGVLADLSRFRLELDDGSRHEPAGSRMGAPFGDCLRGSVRFETPEGRPAAFVVFESRPTIRWAVSGG